MAWSQQQSQRIIDAIERKFDPMPRCSACSQSEWTLANGAVALLLSESPQLYHVGGPTLPCAALVCNFCGNTLLLNLLRLGVGDLLDAPAEAAGIR
jgi:hypothetical protein